MGKQRRGLSFYRKKKKVNKELVSTAILFGFWTLVMVLIAFVFVYCFGIRTSVIGVSMEPALFNGQDVFIDRFTYFMSEPKSADVVVFLPNGNENVHYYVKRVVGLPGDTIIIEDGVLYVNDHAYTDSLIVDKIEEAGIAENLITLLDDEYFVIGDNINNSEDSRLSNIGIVKKEYIIGKVWFHLACDKDGMGFVD